jgi:hypothetical protein
MRVDVCMCACTFPVVSCTYVTVHLLCTYVTVRAVMHVCGVTYPAAQGKTRHRHQLLAPEALLLNACVSACSCVCGVRENGGIQDTKRHSSAQQTQLHW